MSYSLDIQKYVTRHIRYKLRTARHLAWLESLLQPLGLTIDNINAFRIEKLRELDYNGQTISLERVLNDNFDNALRRIYILHSALFNEVDWFVSEGEDADYDFYIGEVSSNGTFGTAGLLADEGWLYNIGENPGDIFGTSGTSGIVLDFEVIVPITLSSYDSQIKGYLDKYKLAGKHYVIKYVS